MEYVFLEDIVVHADHGVYDEEGKLGNEFLFNVKVFGDFSRAKVSDQLSDTVDYAIVFNIITEESKERVQLLEHLAYKIINRIEKLDRIEGIELEIKKKSPALSGDVAYSGYFIKKVFN